MVKTTIGYNDPSSTTATGQVRTWKSGATTYTYAYDARGNITSVSDGQSTTTYAYDSFDQLVREKVIDLKPMTEEEALVQTDLLGHDFYVFTNATTGLINVIYHRKNGGYGIIKPKIEENEE